MGTIEEIDDDDSSVLSFNENSPTMQRILANLSNDSSTQRFVLSHQFDDEEEDNAQLLVAPIYEAPAEEEKEEDAGVLQIVSPALQIDPLPLSPSDRLLGQFRGMIVSTVPSPPPVADNRLLIEAAADTQEGEATSLGLLSAVSAIGIVFTFSGNSGDEDEDTGSDGDEYTESGQQLVLADNSDPGKYAAMVAARSSSSSSSDEEEDSEDEQEEEKEEMKPIGTLWRDDGQGQRRSSLRIRSKYGQKKKQD